MARKFLLCFHDINIWNYRKVVPEIRSLKDLCGRGFSLLVIPCTDGATPEAVREFRDTLLQLESEATCGSHCGPNAIGVAFYAKHR